MGFLQRISSVSTPARVQASSSASRAGWWDITPEGWALPLEAAGVSVTPELALTLSHVFCAVDTISGDFGTMTCQVFRDLGDDGRSRVRYSDPQWGALGYRLRWQPNLWQSAKAFWSTLAWQYLLRPAAYAEIFREPGTDRVRQIIPRHPDRVTQERLAGGTLRFQLREPDGTTRPVLQADMLVVRNTSSDGLNAIGRTRLGAKALATGLTLQDHTRNYFQKGATAALLATYKGDKEEPDEDALHHSISRFMSGSDNAGGVMLVSEDIDVKALGVDPDKAQLLGLKDYSGRDVARLFKMPPHKLGIAGTQTYGSQVQSAQEYVSGCQMPLVVEFEQAIQMVLLADTDVFAKFNMDYLLRADLKTRMDAYEIAIRARVMRPSEARVLEDLNPDPRLDQLSEGDYRPGTKESASRSSGEDARPVASVRTSRASVRSVLIVHDAAQRCVRRERVAVEKLAKKHHPSDVQKWKDELRAFYEDHSHFVASTMRLSLDVARAYAAQHGTLIADQSAAAFSDHFERQEAEELACLACESHEIAA